MKQRKRQKPLANGDSYLFEFSRQVQQNTDIYHPSFAKNTAQNSNGDIFSDEAPRLNISLCGDWILPVYGSRCFPRSMVDI